MPTIAAIATPPGAGAIGIVRLSGARAKGVLSRLFLPLSPKFENFRPWVLHRGRLLDHDGNLLDDVLVVFMPGPRTFTGEDMVEIHCHGGTLLVQAVLESALRLGARQAAVGEFSRRAFLNGRLDLSQAEAVAELIAAPSREALRYGLNRLDGLLASRVLALREQLEAVRVQACLAVDFPEEEVDCLPPELFAQAVAKVAAAVRVLLAGQRRARLMQQGALVVLAGAVNAGKSSLLNALLGRNRALVTDIPGTTRDFLEESCDLEGLPVRLTDTAGLRHCRAATGSRGALEPLDTVEALGVGRSREKLAEADAVLVVLDGAQWGADGAQAAACPDPAAREALELAGSRPVLLAWNKTDLCGPVELPPRWAQGVPCVAVCARTGEHVDSLAAHLRCLLLDDSREQAPADGLAPNARQALALEQALEELAGLEEDVAEGRPYDCCVARLDAALEHLGAVTGLDSPAQVLDRVFADFCIGK